MFGNSVWREQWGYMHQSPCAKQLISEFDTEVGNAIRSYELLPEKIDCKTDPSLYRAAATFSLPPNLADAIMNGPEGYRAHYAYSTGEGEKFNGELVAILCERLASAPFLFDEGERHRELMASFLGKYTKLWFPTSVSDLAVESKLTKLPEVVTFPRWREFWKLKAVPRKGLLAPVSEQRELLLNGTFVDASGDGRDMKPGRSLELYNCGWT